MRDLSKGCEEMPSKKEMKKLRRDQLLEMLIEQTKRKDELEALLAEAEKKLQNREIALQEAGTMAEAALGLNAVFEAADAAASQYLENIRTLSNRQKTLTEQLEVEVQEKCAALEAAAWKHCEAMEAETRDKCEAMATEVRERCGSAEADSRKKCEAMEAETRKKCADMTAKAKQEADAYWAEVSKRMEQYLQDHEELTEWLVRRRESKMQEEES